MPVRLRNLLLPVAAALLATGCAASRDPEPRAITTVTEVEGGYRAVAASALVFDPPVALSEPPIELARGPRQPAAFFGYDEGSVETYRLYVDDRQTFGNSPVGGYRGGRWSGGGNAWGWYDRYDRRATSERVGAIHR
ncbi:MAG TPA: hypothetical protein VF796_13670 [Humisphaera sp.]